MDERNSQDLNKILSSIVENSGDDCFPSFNRVDMGNSQQEPSEENNASQSSKILIIDHPDCPASSAVYNCLQRVDLNQTLLKCSSAADALFLLKMEEDVHLIFFDIDLPKLEGLTLLSRVSEEFPNVELVVLGSSARTIPKTNISIIDRELSPEDTAQIIVDSVQSTSKNDSSASFSILELMQLIEQEKQTTLLEITSNGHKCRCCFEKGELVDALFNDKKGEESLPEIITLTDPMINIMGMPNKKIIRRIHKTISEIIETNVFNIDLSKNKPDNEEVSEDQDNQVTLSNNTERTAEESTTAAPSTNKHNNKEGCIMSLEEHLAKLKGINGFKAAAVMNFTGEILVAESIDNNIQLDLVGATFNDIFRTAHAASEKIGLEACNETTIKTPNGLILMRCSGVKAKVHYHIIMIMAADGNQALAKMEIDKLIPVFMAELA